MSPETPESRRGAIVDAALALVVERGFEGLRLRDVADAVGINSATLVYHVGSKEGLIVEVVRAIMARFRGFNAERGVDFCTPDGLFGHLATIRESMVAAPHLYLALTEIAVRARRYPQIAKALEESLTGWTWVFRRLYGAAAPSADAAQLSAWAATSIAFLWGTSLRSNADGTLAAIAAGGEGAEKAAAAIRSAVDGYAVLIRREVAAWPSR
ncbi:MAG TPA: TetR/AcrR family transcriptional regulator [Candidatus Elarobacter sp.]